MGGRRIGRAFRVKEEEGLGMESLAEHYERLLGLDDDWQVLDVELVWKSSGWRSDWSRWPGRSFVALDAVRSVRLKII